MFVFGLMYCSLMFAFGLMYCSLMFTFGLMCRSLMFVFGRMLFSFDDAKDFYEFSSRDPWEQLSANVRSTPPPPIRPAPMSNSAKPPGMVTNVVWLVCGQCVVGMRSLCGCYVVSVWSLCDWY